MTQIAVTAPGDAESLGAVSRSERNAAVFVATVVFLGGWAVASSALHLASGELSTGWPFFALLTLLSGFFTVKVPSVSSTISVSEAFVFCAVLLYGIDAGTITVALDAAVISLRVGRLRPLHRALFNLSAGPLSIWLASSLYFSLVPSVSISTTPPLLTSVLPLAILAGTYFMLNSMLVAGALSFESRQPIWSIWRQHLMWLCVNYFGGVSVAALLVPYVRTVEPAAIAIIVPLLVISYMTFRIALGRVEDSERHVSKLTRLYLTTIESLASAVDAKDQVTHGHIRRVQELSLRLAKALGVSDCDHLKALDAASLLHDMGKLAIPEFILNKPGKLSPGEFEIMKTHAAIGADMVGTIEFPYPVKPIVRSHHENWNGSGYPDGLSGTDIPLGARILSVVDCYDALTSDRPYRRALATSEAVSILLSRRGSMYDPLVVDTFVDLVGDQSPALMKMDGSCLNPHATEHTADSQELESLFQQDALALASAMAMLPVGNSHTAACRLFAAVSQDIEAAVLYSLNPDGTCLLPLASWGPLNQGGHGPLSLAIGEKISGWALANSATAVNSDASIEFNWLPIGERVVVSAPLVIGSSSVGVATCVSKCGRIFSPSAISNIELLASQAAIYLSRVQSAESNNRIGYSVGLPNLPAADRELYPASVQLRRNTSSFPVSTDADAWLTRHLRPFDGFRVVDEMSVELILPLSSNRYARAIARQLEPHWQALRFDAHRAIPSERAS